MLFISAINPLYSEDNDKRYAFSIEPNAGFILGQSLEVVYPTAGYHNGALLSELKWDMKPVFYFGIKADFGRRDPMSALGFFSSLSFKAGIPGVSGKMEDRDWQSSENDALTNFSSHTNITDAFFWADLSIGASFPVLSILYIKPFLSGSWMHFAFTGRDGYGKYARANGCTLDCTLTYKAPGCTSNHSTSNKPYYPIDYYPYDYSFDGQEVIHYQQDWLIAALGFTLGTKILSPFLFELTFQISPFAYCIAVDEHISRNILFYDYSSFGLFLEPSGKFSFLLKNFCFSLEAAYRYINLTKGQSYYKSTGSETFNKSGEAGAGLHFLDVRLLFKYQF